MQKYIFKSDRISYKEMVECDFEFFYEIHSDPEIMKYSFQNTYSSKENAEIDFQKILYGNDKFYVASLLSGDEKIGLVGYKSLTSSTVEIGYSLKREYWGRGFGTEMAQQIIDYLLQDATIDTIIGTCNANNMASQKILEKIGMHFKEIKKNKRFKDGEWVDEVQYEISKK